GSKARTISTPAELRSSYRRLGAGSCRDRDGRAARAPDAGPGGLHTVRPLALVRPWARHRVDWRWRRAGRMRVGCRAFTEISGRRNSYHCAGARAARSPRGGHFHDLPPDRTRLTDCYSPNGGRVRAHRGARTVMFRYLLQQSEKWRKRPWTCETFPSEPLTNGSRRTLMRFWKA